MSALYSKRAVEQADAKMKRNTKPIAFFMLLSIGHMDIISKSKMKIALGALCLLVQGCSSLIYYPSGKLFYAPERMNLHPEDIWFKSSDGTKLNGWYFHNSTNHPAKAAFVFFHGNGENMSSHYLTLVWIL